MCAGLKTLGPALQYLAGELPMDAGAVIPLQASHNTVRLRFDLEEADYLHLVKPDAAFPAAHLSMLADTARNEVSASTNAPCSCMPISSRYIINAAMVAIYLAIPAQRTR